MTQEELNQIRDRAMGEQDIYHLGVSLARRDMQRRRRVGVPRAVHYCSSARAKQCDAHVCVATLRCYEEQRFAGGLVIHVGPIDFPGKDTLHDGALVAADDCFADAAHPGAAAAAAPRAGRVHGTTGTAVVNL